MSGNGQGRAHHVHEIASMLDAALHYAQIVGVPVFPCNCDDKRPLTAHGFHDATRDDAQIRAWWTRFPDAMIAIPCGEASGVWVLDIDIDPTTGVNGFPLWSQLIAQHGEIPKTLTSITPRGGRHLFFQWQSGLTIKSTQSVPGDGLDTRSSGGYVVVPPSIRVDGSSYRWDPYAGAVPVPAPAWLIALCSPRKESTGRGKAAGKNPKRDQAWAQAALDAECAKIAATPRGQRNAALNLGAYNIFQIIFGNPGLLDEQVVRDCLFKAAEANGSVTDDGPDSVWRTIDSGAAGAQSQPRVRPVARLHMPAGSAGGGLALHTVPGAAPGSASGAAATTAAASSTTRRVIQLTEGDWHDAVDEAEEAILRADWNDIYQRGGMLVRPVLERLAAADSRATIVWRLSEITLPYLLEVFERTCVFTVYDKRSKAWVTKNCPNRIGEMLLARKGGWKASTLLGVVHTPQFRRDGSLAMTQGYDPGTRLLFKPDGEIFPAVPDSPTKDDAIAALKTLEDAIKSFPFKTDIDRSVALSLFLTALCRRTLDHAPMHGISSPAAGTGKSLLVDLGSILTSGQDAPVVSPGRNEEELEKRLGASLLRGDALISLDNCTAPLGGTLLCQALTQRRLHIRILGASRHIEVPTSALFTATGNNLIFEGDITRRSLLCVLDAEVERPALRTFETDIKIVFRERRGELVSAGLTILRARHLARPQPAFAPLGGFEMWSRWVRDALRWLDRADPCRSMDPLREKDPSRIAHEAVVLAWRDAIGIGAEVHAQQILERANLIQELRNALLEVAEERTRSGFISPTRLGKWLAKIEGQISNGLRIMRGGRTKGGVAWHLMS